MSLTVRLLPLLLLCAVAASAAATYRAGSVLHTARGTAGYNGTMAAARGVVAVNLQAYGSLLQEAAADANGPPAVVVFPESGTGYLVVRTDEAGTRAFCEPVQALGWAAAVADCTGAPVVDGALQHAVFASCAARRYDVDIVINFCGAQTSTRGAPAEKRSFYNANFAFEAGTGRLLAVYRKSHINAVPTLTQPTTPDPVTYVSRKAGNVTFGLFICYDLWFVNPTTEEMATLGARDFLYPNGMASLPPVMAIDQAHAGWSLRHGVNLVSSGLFTTGGAGAFERGNVKGLNPYYPLAPGASNVVVSTLASHGATDADDVPVRPTRHALAAAVAGTTKTPPPRRVLSNAVPCFGGVASCAEWTDITPGESVELRANFTGPYGTASCDALVIASAVTPPPANGSAHRWWLVASQIDMVPASPGTPDASQHAFCVVTHCDAPDAQFCDVGAPSQWASDLSVSDAVVWAAFTGGFSTRAAGEGIEVFPLNAFLAQRKNTTAATAAALSPVPLRILGPADASLYFKSADNATKSVFQGAGLPAHANLFSFGVYAAAKGATWAPSPARP